MNVIGLKLLYPGIFFLFIFLTGAWLHRAGKPYSILLVTIHKLIGLAAGVYLGLTVYRTHQASPLDPVQTAAVAFAALLFAVNVATGSLLSAKAAVPQVVSSLNKAAPYLTAVATAAMIYLLA